MVEQNDEENTYDILLVDDELEVLNVLETVIENTDKFDCDIDTAESGEEALDILKEKDFNLVLADHKMPGITGVELLTKVKDMYPNTVRILITGYSDVGIARDAINEAEVHHYLEKPWDNEMIVKTVYRELTRMAERESAEVTEVEDVVDAMKFIREFRNNLKSISDSHPGIVSIPKESQGGRQKIIFEFESSSEFNKFSFELKENQDLKERHKARIEDVQVFNNKYLVTVSLKP
ncbi:MAG: response regulator [Candidatus Saliniplasma sp.]